MIFKSTEVDEVLGFREGYFVVKIEGAYFLMNKSGKLNFSSGFEEISLLYEGKCAFLKNGKWGIINKKGNVLTAPQYSSYSIINGVLTFN